MQYVVAVAALCGVLTSLVGEAPNGPLAPLRSVGMLPCFRTAMSAIRPVAGPLTSCLPPASCSRHVLHFAHRHVCEPRFHAAAGAGPRVAPNPDARAGTCSAWGDHRWVGMIIGGRGGRVMSSSAPLASAVPLPPHLRFNSGWLPLPNPKVPSPRARSRHQLAR